MDRKRKKHQYLIDGGEIPRTTAYRIRKARGEVKASKLFKDAEMEREPPDSSDDESRIPNATREPNRRERRQLATSSLHPANQRCGFYASHQSGQSAGNSCRLSLLLDSLNATHSSDSEEFATLELPSGENLESFECLDETPDNPSLNSPPPVENAPCNLSNNELAHHSYDLLRIEAGDSQSEDFDQNNTAQHSTDEDFNGEEEGEGEEEEIEEEEGDNIHDSDLIHMPNVVIESSTDDTNTKDQLLNNVLCPCSPTTAGDALLYCLALGIRHNLTWAAMVDILKMVNLLYGYEAVSASKYYLQKLFYKQKTAKYHLYCSVCETYLGVKGEEGIESSCECSKDARTDEPCTSFFVSVNIADQFRSLLQREDLAHEILTYRFQRKKINEEAYEDIFDGEAYKNLCQDGEMLGNPYNISYIFNTDGVQMGKSTKNAAWPIFISVAELSPKNRKKHMIFAGVWVSKTQPNMRIFLKPFVDEANSLSDEGFYWTDSQNVSHHTRAFPLCCVVDSAARYKLLNLISYTGYFGCTFCYQQAENTSRGRRFTILNKDAPLRTHTSMIKDMNETFKQRNNPNKKKRIVKGCKGYTPLALMKYFSLDASFVVDSMHNSYLGSSKTHTGHLLNTCRTDYYIGSPEKLGVFDARLCTIRTPSTITRAPRSIDEWKMWKASEWRSWLLCYVLVCLQGLIPTKYIHHFALFSTAMYLLLQKSVTRADVFLANTYLRKYVYLTEKYFGKTAMVYNYHLLLHICKGVLNYGPLWTHNAFQFEGENHHFMQMRTSSGHVAKQLVRRYSIFSQYPNLCEMYASSEKALEFLNEITGKSLKSYTSKDGCVLVGKGRLMPIDSVKICVISMLPQNENADFVAFEKNVF